MSTLVHIAVVVQLGSLMLKTLRKDNVLGKPSNFDFNF